MNCPVEDKNQINIFNFRIALLKVLTDDGKTLGYCEQIGIIEIQSNWHLKHFHTFFSKYFSYNNKLYTVFIILINICINSIFIKE